MDYSSIIAAGIQAGGSAGGMWSGLAGAKKRQQRSQEYTRENMAAAFAHDAAKMDKQHLYQKEYMSNKFQWAAKDMSAAGLNPALMYGSGSASVGGGTPPGGSSGSAPSGAGGSASSMGDMGGSSAFSALQYKLAKKQIDSQVKLNRFKSMQELAGAIDKLTKGHGLGTQQLLDLQKAYLQKFWFKEFGEDFPTNTGKDTFKRENRQNKSGRKNPNHDMRYRE